jgi:hypothetical protein
MFGSSSQFTFARDKLCTWIVFTWNVKMLQRSQVVFFIFIKRWTSTFWNLTISDILIKLSKVQSFKFSLIFTGIRLFVWSINQIFKQNLPDRAKWESWENFCSWNFAYFAYLEVKLTVWNISQTTFWFKTILIGNNRLKVRPKIQRIFKEKKNVF